MAPLVGGTLLVSFPRTSQLFHRCFFPDTWSAPRVAHAFARMAEGGRSKVKEVRRPTLHTDRCLSISILMSCNRTLNIVRL